MNTALPIRRWNSDDFDSMIEFALLAPRGYELKGAVIRTVEAVGPER